MIQLFKHVVIVVFASVLLVLVSTGCNTAHGFGKDVSNAGQGIQNGTK